MEKQASWASHDIEVMQVESVFAHLSKLNLTHLLYKKYHIYCSKSKTSRELYLGKLLCVTSRV